VLGRHRATRRLNRLLLGGELALGFLQARGKFVGLEHPLEDPVLERLDFGLGEAHFFLDRVVLDVGLHRHRLLAELRKPALVHRDVFLNRAAGVLVFGEMGLGRGHVLTGVLEPRLERPFAFGLFGKSAAGGIGRRVELLEGDQAFEVRQHQPSKTKKPRRWRAPGLSGPAFARCASADKPLD